MEISYLLCILLLTKAKITSAEKKFTFAVLANTQAFRLVNDEGDATDEKVNGKKWKEINKKLVNALQSEPNVSFAIINGDITESGSKTQWKAVYNIYDPLKKFLYFYGLGNQDYENNVPSVPQLQNPAMESASRMEKLLQDYKKKEGLKFRMDLVRDDEVATGSFSYSWDYQDVHFVQLHNYPSYNVKLYTPEHKPYGNEKKKLHYNIKRSISWLADDLRLAKFRNISDIIINFHHRKKFVETADDRDRRQFEAIMLTYKPLAVFCGHSDRFGKYNKDSLFGGTTVYEIGPAFDGEFYLVKYENGKLTINAKKAASDHDQVEDLQTYEANRQTQKPICRLEKSGEAPLNAIYSTNLPVHSCKAKKYWHLQHVMDPRNVLGLKKLKEKKTVALFDWHPSSDYLSWCFERDAAFERDDFVEYYWLKNKKSNLVLTSNGDQTLSLENQNQSDLKSQQWRMVKTQNFRINLVNRADDRLLRGIRGTEVKAPGGFDMGDPYFAWKVTNMRSRVALDNIRYYQAIDTDSWNHTLPKNKDEPSKYWKYLGSHKYFTSPPCVGW